MGRADHITTVTLLGLFAFTLVSCGAAPAETNEDLTARSPSAEERSTVVPAASFTAADRQELAAAKARIADGAEVFPGLPNPPLGLCTGEDVTLCEYEQLKAVREWKAAFEGDYGAQRNVAYCLSTGCAGLRPDRVQGCAWRMVIIDAADPQMGEGDVMNLETECGQLSPASRTAAGAHAARIAEAIVRSRRN